MTRVLSFFDVLRFAAGYWITQRGRLAAILCMFIAAALLETYLPTALSNFLGAIRLGSGKSAILLALSVFLENLFSIQIELLFSLRSSSTTSSKPRSSRH